MAGSVLVGHRDHTEYMRRVLTARGVDLVPVFNCYDPPYDPQQGWPLKLPEVQFGDRTLLLLHLQDFVTPTDAGILELNKIQQHYGDRSDRIIVTHWPLGLDRFYHGPLNLVEFNSHEYNIVNNINDRWSELTWIVQQPRVHAWQCLNGRRCDHRLRAARILEKWPNGILSYGQEISLSRWSYATYPGTENEDNFERLGDIYGRCAVNIVTETQYHRSPGIITEKTFFAAISEQIPIVIGYPGIVRDCQSLGLDMFTDLVDVGYDDLDNSVRVEQALFTNQALIQGQIDLAPYRSRLRLQREKLLGTYSLRQRQRFETAIDRVISRLGWQ